MSSLYGVIKDTLKNPEIVRYVSRFCQSSMLRSFYEAIRNSHSTRRLARHYWSYYCLGNIVIRNRKRTREEIQRIQELRRSNAAQPMRNKSKYSRKEKHRDRAYNG